jgi:hypothetical protein
MVTTPYLVLGFFGFLVYRGLKTAQRRVGAGTAEPDATP